MTPVTPALSRALPALFDAERDVRRLHAEVVKSDHAVLVPELASAVSAAIRLEDEDEMALRLVRLSALLGELEGPIAVDLLIDILGCDEPEGRHAAGEALQELAYDRFKEVALGVERALSRVPEGNLALSELPYLLAEVPEPGVRKLLARFLAHKDPEAVAAAIEALVESGDDGSAGLLAPLEQDTREVQLEDGEGEEGRVTLGELASEARKLLLAMSEQRNTGGR